MTQQEKELRDAAMIYTREFGEDVPIQIRSSAHDGFIKGAQWQSQQKQETPELEDLRIKFKKEHDIIGGYGINDKALDVVFNFFARYIKGTEWISVKDRLPEEKELVLVYLSNGVITEMVFLNEHEGFDPYAEPLHKEVTHWQPLPKAPKDK